MPILHKPKDTTINRAEFFTVKELAARWKMSERLIRQMIADGELKVVRFGRSVRIPVDQVKIYEARHLT